MRGSVWLVLVGCTPKEPHETHIADPADTAFDTAGRVETETETEAPCVPDGPLSVSIAPSAPTTVNDLVATITGGCGDATVAWAKDGAGMVGFTSPVVPASATEIWTVVVTDEVGQLATAYVEILNSVPVAHVTIEPATPTTNDDLVATATYTDADNDTVKWGYEWEADGRALNWKSPTLVASRTERGQVVRFTATPFDGYSVGTPVFTSVIIRNSPPTGTLARVDPPALTADSVASCGVEGANDDDGDAIGITVQWEVSGASAGSSPTLDGASFAPGDSVVCIATLDDGFDTGAELRSDPVMVGA